VRAPLMCGSTIGYRHSAHWSKRVAVRRGKADRIGWPMDALSLSIRHTSISAQCQLRVPSSMNAGAEELEASASDRGWGTSMSLSLAGGASAATVPPADIPPRDFSPGHEITLNEEEIAVVSLATFYVFDKENSATPQVQFARHGCGGCRGCRGCRGGRGCGRLLPVLVVRRLPAGLRHRSDWHPT
jgi:hypothetical protein